MLSAELADKIVKEVRKLLAEDVIVVNTAGVIIASTDENRVGAFHEGALLASQKRDKLIISTEDQAKLIGVKAGINLPVFFGADVIGVIGITGNPDQVSPFGEIMRKMTELLIQENYYSEQFDWQSRALEGFLFDWLQLEEWNESFMDRAHLLNIDLKLNRQVVIAQFPSLHPLAYREFWHTVYNWPDKHAEDLIIRRGNDQVIFSIGTLRQKQTNRERIERFQHFLQAQLTSPVAIGVGQFQPAISLKKSYKQAERALKAGKKENALLFDEDLTLEMILEDIKGETKIEFVKRTLAPILNEHDLIMTLKEFVRQNQSLKNTALSLHIHINTLHYRLKKVQDLTGLDPDQMKDLISIYLALQFLDEYTKNQK